MSPVQCTLFSFTPVPMSNISEPLRKSTIKPCPLDLVLTSVLKQCILVLLSTLTMIVNQSLRSTVVPDCFKLSLLNL